MIERALALDPNSAWAWNRSGWVHINEPETAIEHFERAIRLSPFDPLVFNAYVGIADAHFVAQRYEASLKWYERACLTNPKAVWINRTLAAAYVFAGKHELAQASVAKLVDAYPDMNVRRVRDALLHGEEALE